MNFLFGCFYSLYMISKNRALPEIFHKSLFILKLFGKGESFIIVKFVS